MRFLFLSLSCLLLFPLNAVQAALYTGSHVVVDTPKEESLTIIAEEVTLSAPVKGDVTIFAGKTSLSSEISGSTVLVSGEAYLDNAKMDSLRLVAGETFIKNSTILGSLTGIVSLLDIDSGSAVEGESILTGAELNQQGAMGLSTLYFSFMKLGGVFKGSTQLHGSEIQYGDTFQVEGDFVQSGFISQLPPDGKVTGNVLYQSQPEHQFPSLFPDIRDPRVFLFLVLLFSIGHGFVVLTLSDVVKKHTSYMRTYPFQSFLTGSVWFVITPLLILLLFASVFGFYLACLLLGVYGLMLFLLPMLLSFFYGSVLLSTWIHHEDLISKKHLWLMGVVGSIAFLLIHLIPVAGPFANILFGALAVGGLLQSEDRYFGLVKKK